MYWTLTFNVVSLKLSTVNGLKLILATLNVDNLSSTMIGMIVISLPTTKLAEASLNLYPFNLRILSSVALQCPTTLEMYSPDTEPRTLLNALA